MAQSAQPNSASGREPVGPPEGGQGPEWFANYLIDYFNSGERPAYKVVLQLILIVRKSSGLGVFAKTLIERRHAEFGNYLNYMFIVIQADGSREMARLTARMFSEQGVLVISGAKLDGGWRPHVGSPDSTEGSGAGAVVAYEGRALVQLGGEGFFISGRPPPGSWTPKGGSTSVLFVYREAKPNKMYRLDYDILKKGPSAGRRGWEHNQEGVAKILKLKVSNHQPAGGWGKVTGWACRIFKWGGRGLFAVGLGYDTVLIYQALDRGRAVARATGRLAGGIVGGAGGALGAARVGARVGPWSAAGGMLVGGLVLGWFGAALGEAIADWGYCLLFLPLEAEEWRVLNQSQVEEVTRPTAGEEP